MNITDLPIEIIDKIVNEHLPFPMRSVILFVRPFSMCLRETKQEVNQKDRLLFYSAKNGYTSLFLWAYQQHRDHHRLPGIYQTPVSTYGPIQPGTRLEPTLYRFVAQGGSLEILEFLKQNGHQFRDEIYIGGIKGGHIPVINWAIKESVQRPTKTKLRYIAVKNGRLDMLKSLLLYGLIDTQWEGMDLFLTAKSGHLEVLKYIVDISSLNLDEKREMYRGAIRGNSIPILECLKDSDGLSILKEVRHNEESSAVSNEIILTTSYPIAYGSISKIYTKAIAKVSLCDYAALCNHLDVIKWLCKNESPLDSICFLSAIGGRVLGEDNADTSTEKSFDTIKYLVERGCPWDSSVCTRAVEIGDLHILKYLHEKGCPWNAETFAIAKHFDNKEIITYLEREGCPIDNSIQIRILDT